jgi:hypothetical protein
MDLDDGLLLVVPGSHEGPVGNHHGEDGRFGGLVDPEAITAEIASAVPLTGRATRTRRARRGPASGSRRSDQRIEKRR